MSETVHHHVLLNKVISFIINEEFDVDIDLDEKPSD
jgi:hypothetical protein